ncbi:phage antirepressor KilAC domain-containing protein [Paenibacillus barcinonensis]|uniref:Phage antirepressor KilAC domain-containing protein n=1 Tax=Paenibacillus barcinonensis TaxID=198119 RepID=A0A2V4VW15_PAEBA|nr:phage antirepressor N-terminal domain-containing protein [Paenibacillus barcinonensis]PYE51657.1 phage antirepressor YoqD-like protein [Paenibacillus barcinonensis]QKS56017.1 phage antirepressor KilAC domain-containing protein [Paenibacillus barcinonensis]
MSIVESYEQKLVEFNGSELLGVKTDDGKVYVGVRWVCEGIGLTEDQMKNERKRIKNDVVLNKGGLNLTLPTNGGIQDILTIDVEYLPLWLAKISITPTMKDNSPEVVDKLIEYQLKAKDALAQAFIHNPANQYLMLSEEDRAIAYFTQMKEKKLLEVKIEEYKPLITFAETALKSSDNILVRELSKIVQDEGINIGEKKLYQKLRDWKLILSSQREPSQYAMNLNLFVVEENTVNTPYGVKLSTTIKVTPKGQVYIIEKLKKEHSKQLVAN